VRYTVILTDEVKAKLRAMPLALRREVGHKLFLLEDDLAGNVKKLKGSVNEYRLRVGDYRAIFELKGAA
jgi:mRNA-degrading endonuclease RelE of RelBE toxin-antitoxin system